MSSSGGNPVGGRPNDPFEKYYQIKDLEEAREYNTRNAKNASGKGFLLAAYILLLLQKMLEFIQPSKYKNISKSTRKSAQENLVQMQKCLKLLMKEDRSQDDRFLKQLSLCWQKMLEDSLEFTKMTSVAIQFKNFIKEIASYPEAQDHSLGYYLSEYAGNAWLPFPYMELLQKLYTLYQKNPSNNPLTYWVHSLGKIIDLLNQE